jgi:hypothetical protein
LSNLGSVERMLGNIQRATELHAEALRIRQSLGSVIGMVTELENFARIAAASNQSERAAVLLGAAAQLRIEHDIAQSDHDRSRSQSIIVELRESMGSTAFSAAWEQGVALTTEAAAELALSTNTSNHH